MHYRDVKASELILRDLLARDRTVLANERTLLAYVRTALMLAVSGVTLYQLVPEGQAVVTVTALALLGSGAAVLGWGLRSYVRVKRRLAFTDDHDNLEANTLERSQDQS